MYGQTQENSNIEALSYTVQKKKKRTCKNLTGLDKRKQLSMFRHEVEMTVKALK